jgi:hypothetical protein
MLQNSCEGEMKDGKKHGKGKMDFANGDSYTGIWVDDKKTGPGLFTSPGGTTYTIRYSHITRYSILIIELSLIHYQLS